MVFIRIVSIFLSLFLALLAAGFYYEWFHVAIDGGVTGYPWGSIADNPWYYASPKLYAIYFLCWALAMTANLVFWFHSFTVKNDQKIKWSVLIGFALVVLHYFSSQIQLP